VRNPSKQLKRLITPMRVLVVVFAALSSAQGQTVGNKDNRVTVVEGESWLSHLQRTPDQSNMGNTWRFGPPAPLPTEKSAKWEPSRTVTLHGSDVYRLNCQACHGESGLGAPPEINSVINPIRGTSVQFIMARMKNVGMPMTQADARALAMQANSAVLDRLHKGGKEMPPFPQLSEAEIRSLVPYLKKLAGVTVADREQAAVAESTSLLVGEQIVKSTCHICHNALGENPTPLQLMDGKRPPLCALTTRASLPEFVRKVTEGAPVVMGTPPLPYRGRMPVFYYLSKDEAASAYLYLSVYPPQR
jgi:mono/diheme cytochrome c family protein